MNKVYIGTSGWSYNHWQGRFYPPDLPKTKWLEYYGKYFETVEVNSTFYHLPREKTVKNWVERTPSNFIFAVKASRFITHLKQLKDPAESLEKFLQVAGWFGEKLGPILFQFPPGFVKDIKRLNEFLAVLSRSRRVPHSADRGATLIAKNSHSPLYPRSAPTDDTKISTSSHSGPADVRGMGTSPAFGDLRVTLEFRHPSWFCGEIYEILRKANVALCFSDTPFYPYVEEVTADFVYLRLHGHEKLYASCYTKTQLDEYAKKIKNWLQKVKDVYCYFDNDAFSYAVENARELKEILSG